MLFPTQLPPWINAGRFLALSILIGAVCASPTSSQDYAKEITPILREHCFRCHGAEHQEANVRLDNLSGDLVANRAAAETWHEVLNALDSGEMPPEDEPQLSKSQRKILTTWLRSKIDSAIESTRESSGRVVIRRLNRVEYSNTMTELLGLEMDYARDLPPDARSADGFTNNGASLQMSPLQLETYLETARRALAKVIVEGPKPKVFRHEFKETNVKKWLGKPQFSNRLGRQQEFLAKIPKDYPESGAFIVRVSLEAELKANTGYPILEVGVGYRPDTKILFKEFEPVEIKSPIEQVVEFRGRIEDFPLPVRGQGKFPGLVIRIRNIYDDGSKLPMGKNEKKKGMVFPDEPHLPKLNIRSITFEGPYFEEWPPRIHRQILVEIDEKDEKGEQQYVRQILTPFMTRAFRRPVEANEVEKMVSFFAAIRTESPTFEEAMRETLAMVLVRPEFLFVVEPGSEKKRAVTDWELATRLSYFLWSSMPDEELLKKASAKQLVNSKNLGAEVDRMLADPRSEYFVNQFANQWLQLNVLENVEISRDYYPQFNEQLKQDMRGETVQFFARLVRQNQSALELLDSNYSMLNEALAKHYGIKDVYGSEFRKVKLPAELHRGGLLGQASILASNSTGSDSHAVRRAVWLRDRVLGDPPAPPPPDVPSLEKADPKFHKLSIREQLEIHRQREACASCHRNIDPWGIALENFDAVGMWREQVRRKKGKRFESIPVNASDTLPNGQHLEGVEALKQYLVENRKDDFARNLVERLMTYALGRRLELSDQEAVDQISAQFVKDDYRLGNLIKSIVTSESFQTK